MFISLNDVRGYRYQLLGDLARANKNRYRAVNFAWFAPKRDAPTAHPRKQK